MARLKTYWANIDGLHDWAVAAPNQRAALEALGVNQNLFGQGEAGVTDDPAAVKAAQASPGAPVRRLKGKGAYGPVTGDGGWGQALAATKKAAPKKRPSRAALDKAEAALKALEAEEEEAAATFEAERAALTRREATAMEKLSARREKLEAAVRKAREAYEA